MWTIEDNFFVRNRLHPNLAGRTFPHADPFFGNQYQIAVSDLASQLSALSVLMGRREHEYFEASRITRRPRFHAVADAPPQ